jgi:hypothetical protein
MGVVPCAAFGPSRLLLSAVRVRIRSRFTSPGASRPQGYTGSLLRETVDGEVELLIGTRTYRVNRGELRPA